MSKASLTDFAAKNPPIKTGYTAWLETIPEWPEVLAGWKAGISAAQIRRWLVEECGYDTTLATRNRMAHLARQYPRPTRG